MPRTMRSRLRFEAEPIKGSRFIVTAAPVADEHKARALLAEMQATEPDASHHCWAWRLATPAIDRAGDDGEPSGSAGRPILAALSGRDLVDTAVIVTRWFGGTKLGVGGLVRAYGGSAAQALDSADLIEWVAHTTIEFEHEHGETGVIERAIAQFVGVKAEVTWGSTVRRRVTIADGDVTELWVALGDATRGRIAPPDMPDTPND